MKNLTKFLNKNYLTSIKKPFPLNNLININNNTKFIYYNSVSIKNFSMNNKNPFESIKTNEEILNSFNEDFDKLLASNSEDIAKRVRLLSIKLLQINNPREIIALYDEKYIKALINKIYGEEISLIIYFYVSLLDKEANIASNLLFNLRYR